MRVWPARLGDACSGCSTEVNLTDLVGVPGDEAVADPPGEEACSPSDAVASPYPILAHLHRYGGNPGSHLTFDLPHMLHEPLLSPLQLPTHHLQRSVPFKCSARSGSFDKWFSSSSQSAVRRSTFLQLPVRPVSPCPLLEIRDSFLRFLDRPSLVLSALVQVPSQLL